ncbi:MAG: hypothetical protein AAGA20_17450, partial [Planctomycetota bacterium]
MPIDWPDLVTRLDAKCVELVRWWHFARRVTAGGASGPVEEVDGLDSPESFVTHDDDIIPVPMADTDGRWAT